MKPYAKVSRVAQPTTLLFPVYDCQDDEKKAGENKDHSQIKGFENIGSDF